MSMEVPSAEPGGRLGTAWAWAMRLAVWAAMTHGAVLRADVYVETFDITGTNAWLVASEPAQPARGLTWWWDIERVSELTGNGQTGWYYAAAASSNAYTPTACLNLYNNANGYYGNYSRCRHLVWADWGPPAGQRIVEVGMLYKGRAENLTTNRDLNRWHLALCFSNAWYVSEAYAQDLDADRTLPFKSYTWVLGQLTWRRLAALRLDVNTVGQNCNAYGPSDFAHQAHPGNLVAAAGAVPLPEGRPSRVGLFITGGAHLDGSYVQNSRATVYVDDFTVRTERMLGVVLAVR